MNSTLTYKQGLGFNSTSALVKMLKQSKKNSLYLNAHCQTPLGSLLRRVLYLLTESQLTSLKTQKGPNYFGIYDENLLCANPLNLTLSIS